MQQNFKKHLLNILNIIEYQGDKEKYAEDLYQVIIQKVQSEKNDSLEEAIKQQSAFAMQTYFNEVIPTLSVTQKEKLKNYLTSITS